MAFTSQTNAIPKHKTWPSLKIFKANKLRYKLQNPFILKWSEKLVKPRLKLGFLSNYTIWKKVWSFGCQSCFWKPVFASKTDNYPHSPHWQGVWNLPHQFHLYLIKICLSWQPLSGRDQLVDQLHCSNCVLVDMSLEFNNTNSNSIWAIENFNRIT